MKPKAISEEGVLKLTGLIKKAGIYYVALCLELNVSSQGESIEEARRMLQEACGEYLSYMKEEKIVEEIQPVPLEVLREFLLEGAEYVRPSNNWVYSENITFEVEAVV
jgi:predicted RNase H-like HicB family nuclease